ncbi:MAG: hypothetical protein KF861_23235 [Planctomycetaceae bacterium]|nr:hypothetical protein [Planctomycetaceae bacterium]
MDSMMFVDILSRWVHVGASVVLVGGSVFLRFVLMPAAASLQESEHTALRERIMGRWKKIVMGGILLLLISGFYNYLKVTAPLHKGDGLYHGVMGTKILLAFAAFFLASVLTGRSPKFESFRANSSRWLGVLILLTAVIIALGGFLKVARPPQSAEPSASALLDVQRPLN